MAKYNFKGSMLEVSTDGGTTWVQVKGVTSVDMPGPSRNEIATTDSDSLAVESISDIPDHGTMTFGLTLIDGDPGQHVCRSNAYGDADDIHWRMTSPTGKEAEWQGWVNAFPTSGAVGAVYTSNLGVRVNSEVTGSLISAA